jgi:hypothetical protein
MHRCYLVSPVAVGAGCCAMLYFIAHWYVTDTKVLMCHRVAFGAQALADSLFGKANKW